MLKSIKEKLRAIEAERNAKISDNDDSENLGIMECARFIQELDDLSIKGTPLNDRRSVDVLDIRFDDVELESVEISANDGRILDIPADILVHSESYEGMKSFEDFFTEAYSSTDRNYSEPEEVHNNKVRSVAITEGDISVSVVTGCFSMAIANEDYSVAVATGSRNAVSAECEHSIGVAWGHNSKAKGAFNSWLVLRDHNYEEEPKLIKIDGIKYMPDTWYVLEDGVIKEVND